VHRFAVGDLVFFSLAGALGYSEPFTELPVLSVLVVTFAMTAPMTAWMRIAECRGRAIWEMSATMPILASTVLMLGQCAGMSLETGELERARIGPCRAKRALAS
jgi:hypothetical protein